MSLTNTVLQNIRSQSNMDKWEYRQSQVGALEMFRTDSERSDGIITPELVERARTSIGQTLQTPVINYEAGSISNSRSLTIADDENTSALVNFNFTTYEFGFTMVPSLYKNNEIGYQRDFEAKMKKHVYTLADTLDAAALTVVEAGKTQVAADLLGKYSLTSNVVVSPLANKDEIIGDLTPMMRANRYANDEWYVLGNNALSSHVRNNLLEKGQFNTENKTYQYNDKRFFTSLGVTNAAGHSSTGFIINPGSLGMLARHEREALIMNSVDSYEWDIDVLPWINVPVSTYFYKSVGDYSAIAGAASADMDRVVKEHFAFSVDLSFQRAYSSDLSTIASPVMKFAISTT